MRDLINIIESAQAEISCTAFPFRDQSLDEDFEGAVDVHHGTPRQITLPFNPNTHFGSREQASFFAHNEMWDCTLKGRFKREQDPLEHKWPEEIIERAKAEGYDGIVYLNRWEGIDHEDRYEPRIDRSLMPDDLKDWTDEEIKERFPQAQDSYIVFDPATCVQTNKRHKRPEKGWPTFSP